jgi:hypothetical protein
LAPNVVNSFVRHCDFMLHGTSGNTTVTVACCVVADIFCFKWFHDEYYMFRVILQMCVKGCIKSFYFIFYWLVFNYYFFGGGATGNKCLDRHLLVWLTGCELRQNSQKKKNDAVHKCWPHTFQIGCYLILIFALLLRFRVF